MTAEVFFNSPTAPEDSTPALRALWYDAKGEWDAAHACVQDDPSREAAWVHAYLHRREDDDGNAGYWYARAGRTPSAEPFDEERSRIASALFALLTEN